MMSEPKISRHKITEYTPDPKNPNQHSQRGVTILENSLSRVGLGRSIVVDKNGIVLAGNSTQERAVDQGFEDAIEVETDGSQLVVVKRTDLDLSDANGRARELSYFDNQSALLGIDWSAEQVLEDFNAGFDFKDIFSDIDLKDIFADLGNEKEKFYKPPKHSNEASDALREKWGTALGQIWEIQSSTLPGRSHRLMCGDSRDDLPTLMQDQQAQLLVTSPPYCVNKDYEQDMTIEQWQLLLHDVFIAAKDYCRLWFVNLANRRHFNDGFEINTSGKMIDIFEDIGMKLISMRVWTKNTTWLQAHPYWRHTFKPVDEYEFLYLFGDAIPKHKKRLTEEEMTDWGYRGIWHIGSVASNELQSARYPLALPTRAMRLLTDFGETVLDPFVGSGTTIEAGEEIGRLVYSMEKEARDVAVALELLTENQGLVVRKLE